MPKATYHPDILPYLKPIRAMAMLIGIAGAISSLILSVGYPDWFLHLFTGTLSALGYLPLCLSLTGVFGGWLVWHIGVKPLRAVQRVMSAVQPISATITVSYGSEDAYNLFSIWSIAIHPTDACTGLPERVVIIDPPGNFTRFYYYSGQAQIYWDGQPGGVMAISTAKGLLVAEGGR